MLLRRWITPRALGVEGALVLCALLAVATGQPARAADVHGDNGQDRYVGSGGLILPASVPAGPRAQVAGCSGCRWRLATPCMLTLPGAAFPGQSGCLSVVRGCPGMAELLRVWFDSGSGWTDLGLVCLRPGGPVTVAQLSTHVHAQFVMDLPPVSVTSSPSRGVLAQIPVVFSSGQPAGDFSATYQVLGERVDLSGSPHWTWDFGDGSRLTTDDPGGAFPHMRVSHAYRRAGAVRVTARTDWHAVFRVDGMGPFPIREAVSQDAGLAVDVGEGRAVLAVR
jgi:hypothetical protein